MPKPTKQFPYLKDQYIDKDARTLFDWVSRGVIVTTTPNGNMKGTKGDFVFYNNAGTMEMWVNSDSATTWKKV